MILALPLYLILNGDAQLQSAIALPSATCNVTHRYKDKGCACGKACSGRRYHYEAMADHCPNMTLESVWEKCQIQNSNYDKVSVGSTKSCYVDCAKREFAWVWGRRLRKSNKTWDIVFGAIIMAIFCCFVLGYFAALCCATFCDR